MSDNLTRFPASNPGPFAHLDAVEASDSADLPQPGYIWARGSGAVSVVTAGGQTRTIQIEAGDILPVMIRRVRATGTTISDADLFIMR